MSVQLTALGYLPATAPKYAKFLEYVTNFESVTFDKTAAMQRDQFMTHCTASGVPEAQASNAFEVCDKDGSGAINVHEYVLMRHMLDNGSGEELRQDAKLTALGYLPAGARLYHLYEQSAKVFTSVTGGKNEMSLAQFKAYAMQSYKVTDAQATAAFQKEDLDLFSFSLTPDSVCSIVPHAI